MLEDAHVAICLGIDGKLTGMLDVHVFFRRGSLSPLSVIDDGRGDVHYGVDQVFDLTICSTISFEFHHVKVKDGDATWRLIGPS